MRVSKPDGSGGGCWAVVNIKVSDGRRDWSWSHNAVSCGNKPRAFCLTCGTHKHLEDEARTRYEAVTGRPYPTPFRDGENQNPQEPAVSVSQAFDSACDPKKAWEDCPVKSWDVSPAEAFNEGYLVGFGQAESVAKRILTKPEQTAEVSLTNTPPVTPGEAKLIGLLEAVTATLAAAAKVRAEEVKELRKALENLLEDTDDKVGSNCDSALVARALLAKVKP